MATVGGVGWDSTAGDLAIVPDGTIYVAGLVERSIQLGTTESVNDRLPDRFFAALNSDIGVQWAQQIIGESSVNGNAYLLK